MVCRNTSTSRRTEPGFTLIELLVSVAIGALLTIALASLTIYGARSFAALTNYTDMDRQSRRALDIITREIRSSEGLASATTNDVYFNINGGTNNLRYLFNAEARNFAQFKDGERTELLTGCDELIISIYGRNNISNQFSQFAITNVANGKMIQFAWTCSRRILGARLNTESLQTAKIVIRKQN